MLLKTKRSFIVKEIKPCFDKGIKRRAIWKIRVHNKHSVSYGSYGIEPHVQKKTKKIDYDGIVWCVSVPNKRIYVIRNGKSAWVGNSPYIGKKKLGVGTFIYCRYAFSDTN